MTLAMEIATMIIIATILVDNDLIIYDYKQHTLNHLAHSKDLALRHA